MLILLIQQISYQTRFKHWGSPICEELGRGDLYHFYCNQNTHLLIVFIIAEAERKNR